jgi:hypothetical protein
MKRQQERKEFDAEQGAETPLLSKFDKQDEELLTEVAEIARVNTNFPIAGQLAVRATVLMCLISMFVWIPSLASLIPNLPSMALVACLFVFTINPKFGIAVQLGIAGFLGTLWAILHVWFMNFFYPGGLKAEDGVTSWCSLFGWVNFLVFLWLLLWCKCGIGMKMFALSYDIGFCLAFLNPANTTVFSGTGPALSTLIATLVACLAAPLMNLLPYPMSFAYTNMKANAQKASKDTSRLFEAAVAYYTGTQGYSIIIESELKHCSDLRAELDGMGADIGAAWYEGFDGGTRGTVRALMQAHLDMINQVYDRLQAALIAMQNEDFGESHVRSMGRIRGSCLKVAASTKNLLCYITDAACDGSFSAGEKSEIERLILETKDSVRQLARDFDMSRRLMNRPVNTELLGECFFVTALSAYARLVWEYGELMLRNPPQAPGMGEVLSGWITSTWSWSAITDPVNMNFTNKHFIAIFICWMYSVYVDGFSGACVITSVFLINGALCPDIQGFLNVMNAVILAFLTGSMLFKVSCWTGQGAWMLPLVTALMWLFGLYCMFSKSILSLAALFIVALTPFKLVARCPENAADIHANAEGEMSVIKANVLAILFVASIQYLLAYDRPSLMARDSVDAAFNGIRKSFDNFWKALDACEPMGSVAGSLDAGAGYNPSARIEPRLFRYPWKGEYYDEIVAQLRLIRLDILMLAMSMSGSDGKPDAIFNKISNVPEFQQVRDDLNQTISDAHTLAVGLLSCEGGSYDGLQFVKDLDTIDKLDALPMLINKISKGGIGFPMELAASLEDDELCQISAVFCLLDYTVKHIAGLIKITVQYS